MREHLLSTSRHSRAYKQQTKSDRVRDSLKFQSNEKLPRAKTLIARTLGRLTMSSRAVNGKKMEGGTRCGELLVHASSGLTDAHENWGEYALYIWCRHRHLGRLLKTPAKMHATQVHPSPPLLARI